MTVIEYIKNLLHKDIMQDVSRFDLNTDKLGKELDKYSINSIPVTPDSQLYVRGGSNRQFTFALTSNRSTVSESERLDNNDFHNLLYEYFQQMSTYKTFPKWEEYTPFRIELLDNGYVQSISEDDDSARYQVQCRFTYY